MASLDLTAADAVLKEYYDGQMLTDLCYEDHPFFGMIEKKEDYQGKSYPVPIRYGRPQAIGSKFATAQANTVASKYEAWTMVVDGGKKYGFADIDGLTALVSKSDKAGFIRGLTDEIDAVIEEVAREASRNIFRSQSASLGTIGTVATTSLTLNNITDAVLFEVGMRLVFAATEGGALLDSGAEGVVSGVNRNTGVLTSATNWGTQVSGIAATNYIFREGDKEAAGSSTGDSMTGLIDWILSSTPASTAFYGVDRSVDSRLYGTYHDGSAESIEDALINGQSKAAVESGKVDCIIMNNTNYRQLVTALGSKVQYQMIQANNAEGKVAGIAYDSIVIHGDRGMINVVPDPDCQINIAWGLEMKSWMLLSAGSVPQILDQDGLRIQRLATADGYQVRVGYYAQPATNAPGHNVRIDLA